MVSCYPQNGKRKSLDICRDFAAGCGGEVVIDGRYCFGNDTMFYGIDVANEGVWRLASKVTDHDWYYADNAFYDQMRGVFYRVGKNRLQHDGYGASDGKRFRALNLEVKPWRETGEHILVCPQSNHFMEIVVQYEGDWVTDTVAELRRHTDREIRVRPWNRDKKKLAAQLPEALAGAWALVTHSSGSAISAILSGVPAISTGKCIASRMCGDLSTIEEPLKPDRGEWLNLIADQQWTLEEFRDGTAWRMLQQ